MASRDLESELRMREGPCTQEKDELESLLGLGVGFVLDDHDPAPLSDCLSRIAKHGDEIVHQLGRSQSDFLRHPPVNRPSGAGPQHSPKAGHGYLSGRFALKPLTSEGSACALPSLGRFDRSYFFSLKKAFSSVEPSANVTHAR